MNDSPKSKSEKSTKQHTLKSAQQIENWYLKENIYSELRSEYPHNDMVPCIKHHMQDQL